MGFNSGFKGLKVKLASLWSASW